MNSSQRIIGLTGGIGTGKSTVAQLLQGQGLPVIDADQLAREAIAPGSVLLQTIIQHFGPEILDNTGHLDRRRLGQKVFADPQERSWLEHLIHPYVRQQMVQQITQTHAGTAAQAQCLMIPLLFEANMTDLVTEIWVVRCSEEQQIQRLQQRDSLSEAEIRDRIASQWPLEEKIRRADVVLDNSGSLAILRDQVHQALGSIWDSQIKIGSGTPPSP